jgi:hypothetical protein
VSDVYDRHPCAEEDKAIMGDVAAAIMRLAEGKQDGNVITAAFRR